MGGVEVAHAVVIDLRGVKMRLEIQYLRQLGIAWRRSRLQVSYDCVSCLRRQRTCDRTLPIQFATVPHDGGKEAQVRGRQRTPKARELAGAGVMVRIVSRLQ